MKVLNEIFPAAFRKTVAQTHVIISAGKLRRHRPENDKRFFPFVLSLQLSFGHRRPKEEGCCRPVLLQESGGISTTAGLQEDLRVGGEWLDGLTRSIYRKTTPTFGNALRKVFYFSFPVIKCVELKKIFLVFSRCIPKLLLLIPSNY